MQHAWETLEFCVELRSQDLRSQNVVVRRPCRQTTFYKLWSLHPKGTTNPPPADVVTIPAFARGAFHLPPAANKPNIRALWEA